MDLFQAVVANIITTTSISAIVLFIGKAMFSKTVETFFSIQILKAKQELDQKTEGFKLELDRASKVGLHKLEVIQVRRVEKIESIYGEIIDLRDKAKTFLVEYEGGTYEERQKTYGDAIDSFDAFKKSYDTGRIYLSPATTALIDQFISEYLDAIHTVGTLGRFKENYPTRHEKYYEAWQDKFTIFSQTTVPSILIKLADEFKTILGIGSEE